MTTTKNAKDAKKSYVLFVFVIFVSFVVLLAACGSMTPAMTTAPSPAAQVPSPAPPPVAPPPASGPAVVSGTWAGMGADSFSPELMTWVVTQSGTTLSGTAQINAVDPADGTCGSCHKVKRGTLTGTLSGNAVTISMTFPAGGDVPTPICEASMTATGTVADRRITGTYTGSDTCEGIYSNGVIDLARQ
ncbi:MAG TPA: hypothetical protein VN654_17505 [Vicinamibacterales bacterium]|nr:hypothetical protein [Vicinamibacterales bacterium]